MQDTDTFVSNFMEKLKNGELKRVVEPQMDEGVDFTKESVDQHIASFTQLVQSGIVEAALEEGPVLKKNLGTMHKQ